MSKKQKKVSFFPFLVFSIFLHIFGFYLIQRHSLWFYSPIKEQNISKNNVSLPKEAKEQILRQFAKQISTQNPEKVFYKKQQEEELICFNAPLPDLESSYQRPAAPISSSFHASSLLYVEKKDKEPTVNFFSKKKSKTLLSLKKGIKYVPKKSFVEEKPSNYSLKVQDNEQYKFSQIFSYGESAELLQKKFPFKYVSSNPPITLLKSLPKAPSKKTNLMHKTHIPTLKDLQTFLYADDFELDISHVYSKKEGYIFAITLIPNQDIDLPRIPQHYTLLIDRSNSIQKDRLKASRDALYHALSFLKKEDSFNVIAFDNKMEKLFPSHRKISSQTKQLAKKFLMNLKLASFFASPNIYNPLYSSTYNQSSDNSIQSIILLSNGEGLSHKALQHLFMGRWTGFNAGKASLFSISMDDDTQIADLELVSTLNRGWLITSSTKGGLKRKIMKLMKTIQNPIIKDVTCSYITKTNNRIELFRPYKGLPHLYAAEPYVIIGRCEKLEDFVLVLQGKNGEKWLNIKKNISLSNSKKADFVLEEQWAMHKAWTCYYDYLKDADPKHLRRAEKILEPFDIPGAFQ